MTPQLGQVPFREAIDFFRQKGMVLTDRWPELWQEQHQVAFTVAGVAHMQMLADIRAAVDRAIATGTTLADFRRDFDEVIRTHGWTLRGTPGWRSRVIFETNLRTAYAAGRWAQIERLQAARPFIRYSAVLDNRTRPLHRDWHGTILPVQHPWWNTHFPPNGWRCRCTVISLAQRDLDRRGWKVTDPAPSLSMRQVAVEGRGTIEVPVGIDPGFGYNPGKGAVARQAEAVAQRAMGGARPELAAAARAVLASPTLPPTPAALTAYPEWAQAVLEQKNADGTFRRVGSLPDDVLAQLPGGAENAGDPDIVLTAEALLHMARSSKQARGAGLSVADLLRLPEIVANPDAILRDKRDGDVLLVFTPSGAEGRDGAKLVVHLAYRQKVRSGEEKFYLTFNAIKSGGLVSRNVLRSRTEYQVLSGAV